MSTLMELTVVLVVCPALLALWADVRFPNLRPTELGRTVLHLGIAGVIGVVVMRPLLLGVAATLDGPMAHAASIALACAVITYASMVTLWVMRTAVDIARVQR